MYKKILNIIEHNGIPVCEVMKANVKLKFDTNLIIQNIRRTNVNLELQRILSKEFNITDISTHSLRHTYGTRCIESGMAPVVVQKLMGHKDIGITLNTYTSVFDKFKENEIDKVNRYYMNENLISNNSLNYINDSINNNTEELENRWTKQI